MKNVRRSVITAGVFAVLLGCSPSNTMAQEQDLPLLGCVKPGTGLLRILQPGETCKNNEAPLGFDNLPLLVAQRDRVRELEERIQTLGEQVEDLKKCVGDYCYKE